MVQLHGVPRTIVSDWDPLFLSNFLGEIFRIQGTIKIQYRYHPQLDGQTEVLNRWLETYLRCFSSEQPRGWSKRLCWAEYWYTTGFQSAIRRTPFEVIYGWPSPALHQYLPGETRVEVISQHFQDRDEILRQLKFNLHRAQKIMKKNADKHRRDLEFAVGDRVFLKLRPHR